MSFRIRFQLCKDCGKGHRSRYGFCRSCYRANHEAKKIRDEIGNSILVKLGKAIGCPVYLSGHVDTLGDLTQLAESGE